MIESIFQAIFSFIEMILHIIVGFFVKKPDNKSNKRFSSTKHVFVTTIIVWVIIISVLFLFFGSASEDKEINQESKVTLKIDGKVVKEMSPDKVMDFLNELKYDLEKTDDSK